MKAIAFFRKSFENTFGEIDGKLITACVAMLVLLIAVAMFYLTGATLPEHMWYSLFSLVAVGFGFGTLETITELKLRRPAKPNPLTDDSQSDYQMEGAAPGASGLLAPDAGPVDQPAAGSHPA